MVDYYKKAACLLVLDRDYNRFLAVSLKNDPSDFNLPGGKVEKEETYKEAAIRELKEETGIEVKTHLVYPLLTGVFDQYLVQTFYTESWKGEINTKEEGIVKWLPLYHLTKSKTWPKYNSQVYFSYLIERLA